MLKHLPNALTLLRLLLAPVIGLAIWEAYALTADSGAVQQYWALAAAGLFLLAALTDLIDGILARALKAETKFGRIIDPIADKALVGLPLIAITFVAWQIGQDLWWLVAAPTGVIVVRDIVMTLIRLMAPDGEGVRVSRLAKWKTALEIIAVGLPILMVATPSLLRIAGLDTQIAPMPELGAALMFLWLGLLTLAALLSFVTFVQYLLPPPKPRPVQTDEIEPQPATAALAEPAPAEADAAPEAESEMADPAETNREDANP